MKWLYNERQTCGARHATRIIEVMVLKMWKGRALAVYLLVSPMAAAYATIHNNAETNYVPASVYTSSLEKDTERSREFIWRLRHMPRSVLK